MILWQRLGEMRVLFVDDEEGVRNLAKEFLESENRDIEVNIASSGAQALSILGEKSYDVIVADYRMSGMDGLELLDHLRSRENDIPFILLTARGMEEVAMRALNLGADRYLKKAPDPSKQYRELTEAILDVVEESKGTFNLGMLPSRIRRLLVDMLEGRVREIGPRYEVSAEEKVSYPGLEGYIETSSVEFMEVLELLADEEILLREFSDKHIICPEDGSYMEYLTRCPVCNSMDIIREEMIEHLECGHVRPVEDFVTDAGDYVCPKCNRNLRAIGVDYSRMGDVYRCSECQEVFDTPEEIFRCVTCREVYQKGQVDFEKVYRYTLNPEKRGWLRLRLS